MQEHHAEERHEQDIQRRQKARLARFNVRNGVLLHDGRGDHKHAAHSAADGDLFRVALLPLLRLFPPVGYKKKNSQRQSCEHTAIEVEGDGSDMSRGHALKGKRARAVSAVFKLNPFFIMCILYGFSVELARRWPKKLLYKKTD